MDVETQTTPPPPAGDLARPAVTVVVPFAGTRAAAERVLATFARLRLGPADDAVFADNSADGAAVELAPPPGWRIVAASGEGSPARARNAGALNARGDWILFVDSDCHPPPDLIDRYFEHPIGPSVGLIAGGVEDLRGQSSLVARYTRSRKLLDQRRPLAHDFLPYALTANLLVRSELWRRLGGFLDGIRNAEDVDFCWRAQRAGWTLEFHPTAEVEHEHRETVGAIWRQVRVSAASASWVHRRWPDADSSDERWGRVLARAVVGVPALALTGRVERARLRALDCVVVAATVVGLRSSNRAPARPLPGPTPATRVPVQLWCDEFPLVSETFVVSEARELARLGHPIEVLAFRRPDHPALGVHDVPVRYLEDDTRWERATALARLACRHPLALVRDKLDRGRWRADEAPKPLRWLAPAALRLSPSTRVHVHFAGGAALDALRLTRIIGSGFSLTVHGYDVYKLPRNLDAKLRAARFVAVPCDYFAREVRARLGDDADSRVHRIVMGVDPQRFARRAPHPERAVVLAVGRLVAKKGFVHLVRAAADPALRGPLAELVIVGEGPEHAALAAEIERLELQDRVRLAGRMEPDEIRAELERAAVLACPCVIAADGDRDSMPVVVKEALAMEVPVVVSDAVGLPEIVRPEFGRAVAPGDPPALAAALAELLALPVDQRAAMGRAGRAFVCKHAHVATETAKLSALLSER